MSDSCQRWGSAVQQLALALLVVSCGIGSEIVNLGSEEDLSHTVTLRFENSSDEYRYVIRARADTDQETALSSLGLSAAAPGESVQLGVGPSLNDPVPSLCLQDEQLWVVRSRTGTPWWRSWEEAYAPPREVSDLEILQHFSDASCFDSDVMTFILE